MAQDAFSMLMGGARAGLEQGGREPKRAKFASAPDAGAAHDAGAVKWLIVYDLEATCDRAKQLRPQEIIELSCAVLCLSSREVVAKWQRMVRPTEHPKLTDFCEELTGITQHDVDSAATLQDVLQQHDVWLRTSGYLPDDVPAYEPVCCSHSTQQGPAHADSQAERASQPDSAAPRAQDEADPTRGLPDAASVVKHLPFVPVTWTDWDFQVQMETECKWRKIAKPLYFNSWCNIKALHQRRYGFVHSLPRTLEEAGMPFEGRHHSALADALNTAALAIKMMTDGVRFKVTNSFFWHTDQKSSGPGRSGAKAKQQVLPFGRSTCAAHRGASAQGLAGATGSRSKALGKSMSSGGSWNGLCDCGVKAALRTTNKPGPTHGRAFYSCGTFSILRGSGKCNFFMWKDDLKAKAR